MSDLKQANGRPEGLPVNAGRRTRIEDVGAVGETLTEEGLRLVAGGLRSTGDKTTGCIPGVTGDPLEI